jgi:hypothetical protein
MRSACVCGWLPRLLVASVTVLVTGLTGCASSTPAAVFNSRTNIASTAPVDRLLVIERVDDIGVDKGVQFGFQAGLAQRLRTCGVTSRLLHIERLELDPDEPIAMTIKEFQPRTILSIKVIGGNLVERDAGSRGQLLLGLKLLDVASNQVTWEARSQLQVSTSSWKDGTVDGMDFASSIVARLRDDGVLRGCPTDTAAWKELSCLERRKLVLKEISDQHKRAETLGPLPRCE